MMTPAKTETSRYRAAVSAAGGTAPISRSRVIPPKLRVTKEITRMPQMSRRRLTAATAPLIAKTNVPPKSRNRPKVSIELMTAPPEKAYRSNPKKHQLAPTQAHAPTNIPSTPHHHTYSTHA